MWFSLLLGVFESVFVFASLLLRVFLLSLLSSSTFLVYGTTVVCHCTTVGVGGSLQVRGPPGAWYYRYFRGRIFLLLLNERYYRQRAVLPPRRYYRDARGTSAPARAGGG